MHQNLFPLGLCPRPHWRSLQHSPDPIAGFKAPTSKGREERVEREIRREGKGRGRGSEATGIGKVKSWQPYCQRLQKMYES